MSNLDRPEIHACSACRGDYEDPDASVRHDDSSQREDDESDGESNEEFPVRRERR